MYTRHSLVKIQQGHLIQIFFRIIGGVGNLSEPRKMDLSKEILTVN